MRSIVLPSQLRSHLKKSHFNKMTNAVKTWIYTLNNYTEEELTALRALTASRHRSCHEVGESGTPHLQGCITFKRGYRATQLKKLFPRAHWEIARSRDPENYCIKGDIMIDIIPQQGTRTDLHTVSEKILSGNDLSDVAMEHPVEFIKYHRGFAELKRILQPHLTKFTPTEVTILYGPPGTGKTRSAYEAHPDLYTICEPPQSHNPTIWFDGYTGQDTILLDDFYGWIPYAQILRFTDGYPQTLPIKGSTVKRNWTKVIITSNNNPFPYTSEQCTWYPNQKNAKAFFRRISHIKRLDALHEETDKLKESNIQDQETQPSEEESRRQQELSSSLQ